MAIRYLRFCLHAVPMAILLLGTARADDAGSRALKVALSLKPDVEHGSRIYARCAVCHGASGAGSVDGKVPVLAAQSAPALTRQLVAFQYDKRRDLRMRHVVSSADLATPQDIADVAAFISEMPPARGVPDPQALGSHGEAVYLGHCAICHGLEGEGSRSARVPRLAGQSAQYVYLQLIQTGSPNRPAMHLDHEDALRGLDDADIRAMSAAIAAFQPRQRRDRN